jgi:hypothetical protein
VYSRQTIRRGHVEGSRSLAEQMTVAEKGGIEIPDPR